MNNTTKINAENKNPVFYMSGSPTKKDAENDPLRTRTQSMHKTSRGQMPVPSPVSLPFNPRDSTKGPYSY